MSEETESAQVKGLDIPVQEGGNTLLRTIYVLTDVNPGAEERTFQPADDPCID